MSETADPSAAVPSAPTVAVVVPAQRAGALLARQLDALSSQVAAPPFTTVVVLDIDDPGVTLVESYRDRLRLLTVVVPRRGAAAARNAGVAACDGSVLLFCDADDVVGPGWVRAMAVEVQHTGLCGSPMRVEWEVCPRWARPFYEPDDSSSVEEFHGVVPFVVSASLGIDRALFDAVGGFDESFPGAGGEEVDLCLRLAVLRGPESVIGAVVDETALVRYRPRSSFRSIARQRAGYSRGTVRLMARHRIGEFGTLASIEPRRLLRMARSPRRLAVLTWSFIALRGEMRPRRRSRVATTDE